MASKSPLQPPLPPWVLCNACTAHPEGELGGLMVTSCRHVFCHQCAPKDKCPVCNKVIRAASSSTDMGQKSASRVFFQDPVRLLEILDFQMKQMTMALKYTRSMKQASSYTGDDSYDILRREIVVLKEENRYWKGLFNSTYKADTPKSSAGRMFTASPSVGELHALSSSCSSTENSPIKQKRVSESKDSRKVVLLTKELGALKDEKASLLEEIKQLKATIEETRCRERILYQQVATGNDQMKSLNCELQAYQSKCRMLEEETLILKTLMNEGREQLAKSTTEITRLEQAAEEVTAKTTLVIKQEINEKNNELNQLTKVIESLNHKLQESKDEQNREREKMDLLLEQKDAEIKRLESKHEELEQKLTSPTRYSERKIVPQGKPYGHKSHSDTPLNTSVCATPKQNTMSSTTFCNVRRTPWKKPID